MINRTRLSPASWLTVFGLVVAAAGISTLFLTNSVNVPAIPIGPILLLGVAGLIAFGPWRWTPIVGVLVAVFITVGAIVAPGLLDRLSNPAHMGAFVGTWVQMLGLIIAIIAGVTAAMQNYQTRSQPTSF